MTSSCDKVESNALLSLSIDTLDSKNKVSIDIAHTSSAVLKLAEKIDESAAVVVGLKLEHLRLCSVFRRDTRSCQFVIMRSAFECCAIFP